MSSDFSRTHSSLTLFHELKQTVSAISCKRGGKTEKESITLDCIISGSMSPTTFDDTTYREFRQDWGSQFDFETLRRRFDAKVEFDAGNLDALVDFTKWEGSGHNWDDEAIDLFRSFYQLPSPAVYLDHTGRKVNFKDFDGKDQYEFLHGLNPKSNVGF